MSEQTQVERPSVDFARRDDVAFGALMDALTAQEATGEASEAPDGAPGGDVQSGDSGAPGGAQAAPGGADGPGTGGAPAAPAGGPAAPGSGDAAAGQPASGQGGGGKQEQPSADGASDGGAGQPPAVSPGSDLPAAWTVAASTVIPEINKLSTSFEEGVTKAYQQSAYEASREDYGNYFDALDKHPRLLVGTEVPRIGSEGMETLRDTADAKEWQDAVKSLLVEDINERTEQKMEEARDFIDTVHASIDLFKNNADLIPGTTGFNRKLADQFAQMAQPYEIRDEETKKLVGYSIPVQPLIDRIRATMKAEPQAPARTPTTGPQGKKPSQKAEPPQQGVASKAGSAAEREDFSTLFGTIGLPNLQI